jgi:hypothetical protein
MKERLAVAAVLGALAVLVGVVVVVVQFGRVDPSPPSLIDNPNPAIPGEILYFDNFGCAVRIRASGAAQAKECGEGFRGPVSFGWVTATTIAWWEGDRLVEMDIETGERTPRGDVDVSRRRYPERPGVSVNGETAVAEGGRLFVMGRDGSREQIARFDVGSSWIQPTLWSPDGDWLLVQWYPPRGSGAELWIVSRDGRTRGTIVEEGLGFPEPVGWWIDGAGGTPSFDQIVAPAASR